MTLAIRQHAHAADATTEAVVFGMAVLADSLILIRLVRGRATTEPTMNTAAFTRVDGAHATNNYGLGEEIDSGAVAVWAKVVSGGQTTFSRDVSTGYQYMCAYEITGGATLDDITSLSVTNAGTSTTSDLGSFLNASGLAFATHIMVAREAGVKAYSGVTAGDYTEVHDNHVTESGGNPDECFYWMGNATGDGGNLHAAATFSGSPAMVNTGGVAVLVSEPVPFVTQFMEVSFTQPDDAAGENTLSFFEGWA